MSKIRKKLQALSGTAFFASTLLNVSEVGFHLCSTVALIAGTLFFINTMIGLGD